MPENPDNHTESHKYPFMAIDILTSSIRIAKAITEGGYTMDPPEENEDVLCRQPSSDIFGESETNMVQNILNGNKSTSNESKNSDKKEQLVETLDQELGLDSDQQDNEKNKESVAEGEDKEAGEEKQEEKAERSSPDENKEEAEEESEDVDQEENDEGVKIQVSASVQAKKTNLAPEEENKRKESIQEEEQYHDYGILDTIGSFLESDDEL